MDEKMLEQEYRKLKQQAAPDLWSRIESNLAEHPEREAKAETAESMAGASEPADSDRLGRSRRRIAVWKPAYGVAAAAALVVVTVIANRQTGYKSMAPEMMMQETMAAAADAAPMAPEHELAEAAGDAGQSNRTEAGGAGGKAHAGIPAGALAGASVGSSAERGVLSYEDLELAAYQPLAVPDQAVTVPEDSAYFSEAILGDTGLLCGGTVTDVSLETDASGKAVKVVYEISLDQVYYSEDYTTGIENLTVKSPIVETEGDEAYVLYQLQKGGTYLLPLVNRDGVWELLYPFAPQIQVTGDGAYLFHSGYASLVSSETSVVIGSQEGASDYYYDRMLLRTDDNFLSDLISLVEREAQGRK